MDKYLDFKYGILFLCILFGIINVIVPIISDDILYGFFYPKVMVEGVPHGVDQSHPISNFGDILESQYNHYFNHGGRAPIHILVQLFAGILGKYIYSIITAFVFGIFIIFLGKTAFGHLEQNKRYLYIIPSLILLVFIIHPACFYNTIACGINYLWASTLCIILHLKMLT